MVTVAEAFENWHPAWSSRDILFGFTSLNVIGAAVLVPAVVEPWRQYWSRHR
jgi:Na+/alanine symporter